ncbi:hypothetical protein CDL15_Pgr010480 [Punica granatum]|uniref:Uncharacterized protein n=1 Tax=Punica granatum TaxID=22663 RepID=A0A218XW51_PUNGR|nr:hypothetical protein CDL15_Pgr010480 [Punica granatum]
MITSEETELLINSKQSILLLTESTACTNDLRVHIHDNWMEPFVHPTIIVKFLHNFNVHVEETDMDIEMANAVNELSSVERVNDQYRL